MARWTRSDTETHKADCICICTVYKSQCPNNRVAVDTLQIQLCLLGVFADEALEKFFGQARQRSAGNFYIDVVDIKASAETMNLRALLKYDSTLQPHSDVPCTCSIHIEEDQFDITISETEDFVQSNDTLKT